MLDPEDNSTVILHMLVTMCPVKQRHIPDDLSPSNTNVTASNLTWFIHIFHLCQNDEQFTLQIATIYFYMHTF